jgi:cysteine desulfurase
MATPPLDPEVIDAMAPWWGGARFGNPHAILSPAGRAAEEAVDEALASIAAMIGASPGEIVLTSGATESDNMAIIGATRPGDHLITQATEHSAVLASAERAEQKGRGVTIVGVDRHGLVDPDAIRAAIRPETRLASVMAINSETGARQPVAEIARVCRAAGVLYHCDATQALSTVAFDLGALPIDLMSLSSHKIHGPQGIGALYVRDGVAVEPIIVGGGQQNDRRSGTVPVALAVGFGAACRAVIAKRDADAVRLTELRERLWQGLSAAIPQAVRTIPPEIGGARCLHVSIPGLDAAELLLDLPELSASTGSACAAGGKSAVLQAMGLGARESFGALRFGLGRFSTVDDVDGAVAMVGGAVRAALARRSAAE